MHDHGFCISRNIARLRWPHFAVLALSVLFASSGSPTSYAQQPAANPPAGNWSAAVNAQPNSTTIPQTPAAASAQQNGDKVSIKLVALLTAQGPQIDKGLIWRVYDFNAIALNTIVSAAPKLLSAHRIASPTISLPPGTYAINAAFGQANLTRKVTVAASSGSGSGKVENFILNAGGLRLRPRLSNGKIPTDNAIRLEIFSDQRNQFGERTKIIDDIKAGTVVRLNAGLYFVKSTYGDANSKVSSDVAVEAGKLTEVALTHGAARVTLKLVTRAGGEALADARWQLETAKGIAVLKTVGAVPSHILAAGSYVVTVRYGADALKRSFSVAAGQDVAVEVIIP